MESAHPFSVSFAPCFQGILCRSRLFFRMFLDKLFQICADRFIMKQKRRCFSPFLLSPSSRRAWIEIAGRNGQEIRAQPSPSSRRAWIEMTEGGDKHCLISLSPSSRRAWIEIHKSCEFCRWHLVALLAEGVDRNTESPPAESAPGKSPSSRRAWIEMRLSLTLTPSPASRPPRGGRG